MRRCLAGLFCVAVLLSMVTVARASILANAVRDGNNTINDTDGESYTPITPGGNPGGLFTVGDRFDFVLDENNIINSAFLNTPLTTATGGGANYQLAAVGSFVITTINNPSVTGGAPLVDLLFSGSIDVYETTNPLLAIDFTTDTFLGATAKVVAGTKLLSLATLAGDFLQQLQAPNSPSLIPGFPGITADGGLTVTFASPTLGFNVVPLGASTFVPNFTTGIPGTTFHDVVVREQFFVNDTGVNDIEFPFFTDTTVKFRALITPEPMSLLLWLGLAATSAIVLRKKLK